MTHRSRAKDLPSAAGAVSAWQQQLPRAVHWSASNHHSSPSAASKALGLWSSIVTSAVCSHAPDQDPPVFDQLLQDRARNLFDLRESLTLLGDDLVDVVNCAM
jgi:hypothetical protein